MEKITDEDVKKALNGEISNELLRDFLCSKDVSKIDMSQLSKEMFKYLSFDENTIFSDDQKAKFQPAQILKEGMHFSKDMDKIHSSGITGKGVKVVIIDSNIESNDYFKSKGENIQIINNPLEGKKEVHGSTVLSSFLSVAPDSKVIYIPNDKYDRENKDENLLNHIENVINNYSDIAAVSISSSFNDDKNREKAKKMLESAGIALIDSPDFYNNFTYSRKTEDKDGNETFEETFCIEDETGTNAIFDAITSVIKKYELEDLDRKEAVEKVFEIIEKNGSDDDRKKLTFLRNNPDLAFSNTKEDALIAKKKKLVKDEINERKGRESIEIPCAGRTFIGKNGAFKYFSTASASYTIPQVTALFALAKEINPSIKYDDFVKICKETSSISKDTNIDNYTRHIINPNQLFIEISRLTKQSLSNNKNIISTEDLKKQVITELINTQLTDNITEKEHIEEKESAIENIN